MIITRKAMGRRTVLRGMGVTLSLPLLEAMSSSPKAAESAARARKRLQVIYTPNGMVMQNFTPTEMGEGYALSPILKPLELTGTNSRSSAIWIMCRPKRWAMAAGIMRAAAGPI